MEIYVRNLRKDAVVIDVGANIGLTALILSQACPDGHVYAVEGSPINANFLRQNLVLNGVTNCTVIETAVGAEKADDVAFLREGPHAHVVIAPDFYGNSLSTVGTPLTTVDALVERLNLSRVDLIKIDVEGYEPAVLVGAAATLSRFGTPVFMEFNAWALMVLHQVNPFTFAKLLFDAFDVCEVQPDGTLVPAGGTGGHAKFMENNIVRRGCIDDVIVHIRPGRSVPPLDAMKGVFAL